MRELAIEGVSKCVQDPDNKETTFINNRRDAVCVCVCVCVCLSVRLPCVCPVCVCVCVTLSACVSELASEGVSKCVQDPDNKETSFINNRRDAVHVCVCVCVCV